MFKAKDVVELVFNNNDYSNKVNYAFRFYKKHHIKNEINISDLMGRFDEVQFGKI